MHNENDMSVRFIVYVDIFCKIHDLVKFTRKDKEIWLNYKRNKQDLQNGQSLPKKPLWQRKDRGFPVSFMVKVLQRATTTKTK